MDDTYAAKILQNMDIREKEIKVREDAKNMNSAISIFTDLNLTNHIYKEHLAEAKENCKYIYENANMDYGREPEYRADDPDSEEVHQRIADCEKT